MSIEHATKDHDEADASSSNELVAHAAHLAHELIDDAGNDPAEDPSLRPIIVQTVLISLVLVALLVIGALFFKEPIDELSRWVVVHLGLPGIIVAVMISDVLTAPIPPDTMLFMAATSPDIHNGVAIVTISLASTIAGSIAYVVGPYLSKLPIIREKIEGFRPRGEALFERWGSWAVAIGALSPLPYSIFCWMAGIYKMDYKRFFIATLFRIPRIAGYYALFMFGWASIG